MGPLFNAFEAGFIWQYQRINLIVGGLAFGVVFMATDPVTSSQINCGKYIVGL